MIKFISIINGRLIEIGQTQIKVEFFNITESIARIVLQKFEICPLFFPKNIDLRLIELWQNTLQTKPL